MAQLVRVARIQLVNVFSVLVLPMLIVALVLVGNIVLSGAFASGGFATGGLFALYATMLVAHLQTMTQMFPFALGLSVTRKEFFGATTMVVSGQAAIYGVLLTMGKLVEEATGGWGVELTFLALPFLSHDNVFLQFLAYTAPLVALSFLGVWIGIVFKRWGQYGVWALGVSLGAVVVGLALIVNWQDWWDELGRFLSSQPAIALQAGYPMVITLLLAGVSYLTMRRAVP
ncbi:hypothetical protein [Saccharomonospora xinjiangensis]|uniref:Uncharacterized protein n=1 Tax=Saccharomonospora xinjiangensis XJ-54 TaxID=882086 RepID=I0V2M2_9PSEU|nr:hypothetical protein [Saccharomonospora xinjiangensis]EID54375.1 hypothetical protein SacxiDRAFT_2143 [Saccharomonospora xinjiangensis XJ-54]